MKKFFVLVTVGCCDYIVTVNANSALIAEHEILSFVTQYKGERKVYCSAYDDVNLMSGYFNTAETIDMIGIERVITQYCESCKVSEIKSEMVDKVSKVCELVNKLGKGFENEYDLEKLTHNNEVLSEMIKVLSNK